MAIHSISSTTAIVPFLLKEDNYEDWRIYMENHLLAQDLWGIIESGDDADCPSSSNDVENWRKKNGAALHAIHITSSPNIFAQIKGIRSAKDAWNKLAQMHQEWQSKSKLKTRGGGEEDEMTEDFRCVELKKSICNGDWNAVKQFFVCEKHPLDTRIMSGKDHTALHVAIQSGQDKIAEELIKMMLETDLEIKTASTGGGHTALSLAAYAGRTHVAKCIVQKNSKLLTIASKKGHIPVGSACAVGQKEMTYYLYSVTPPEVLLPQNGNYGFELMRWGIDNKMLGLPKKLIISLITLFVSTTMMMASVCAALLITLQVQRWAFILVLSMASIPITLFVWLQFPLLVENFCFNICFWKLYEENEVLADKLKSKLINLVVSLLGKINSIACCLVSSVGTFINFCVLFRPVWHSGSNPADSK